LVLVVPSPLNTQHTGVRAITGLLELGIICPNEAICLLSDCCFTELAL
jgi:hypothetical protein